MTSWNAAPTRINSDVQFGFHHLYIRVILQNVSFTLISVQNFCPLRLQKVLVSTNLTLILWAWQGVAKIKIACNLVLLTGISVVCMT